MMCIWLLLHFFKRPFLYHHSFLKFLFIFEISGNIFLVLRLTHLFCFQSFSSFQNSSSPLEYPCFFVILSASFLFRVAFTL
ncbi:hypothetical protein C2G38_2117502 [Gigaspora rosea]|uniref:Uncharacterized protein n=1 Tax=Gigaspora rosea TaxID=44941 RepID=A0A397U6A3_9GLOM|nr:hypothetical protein C2G38_2117502 [Gigaspora rosea]